MGSAGRCRSITRKRSSDPSTDVSARTDPASLQRACGRCVERKCLLPRNPGQTLQESLASGSIGNKHIVIFQNGPMSP